MRTAATGEAPAPLRAGSGVPLERRPRGQQATEGRGNAEAGGGPSALPACPLMPCGFSAPSPRGGTEPASTPSVRGGAAE